MHYKGHVGAALLAFSPVAFVLVAADAAELALYGCLAAVALSVLPDVDCWLPIPHRGPTHTVWFLVAVVVGLAVLGWSGAAGLGLAGVEGGAFLAVVGTTSVGSHVFVDVLTPMGIRPFAPLARRTYTLDLVKSRDRTWNVRLLGVGTACVLAAALLGTVVGSLVV